MLKFEIFKKHLNVGLFIFGIFSLSHAGATEKAKLYVVTNVSPETFEKKQKALLKEAAIDVNTVLLFAPRQDMAASKVNPLEVLAALKTLPAETAVLYFDFNFKMQDSWKEVLNHCNQLDEKKVLIVASAGLAGATEVSVLLNRTFSGQIKKAILIGELTERERLLPASFFGPELLTAVKPPREWIGQGYAPIMFAGRMAMQVQRKKQDDWLGYLNSRKSKTKKLWAELEDFFPRGSF